MVQLVDKISEIRNGKRVIVKKPELLAPAGNLEKLKIAVMYGADAVFIGGQEYSLRSNADNFTLEEIKEGVSFAKNIMPKCMLQRILLPITKISPAWKITCADWKTPELAELSLQIL